MPFHSTQPEYWYPIYTSSMSGPLSPPQLLSFSPVRLQSCVGRLARSDSRTEDIQFRSEFAGGRSRPTEPGGNPVIRPQSARSPLSIPPVQRKPTFLLLSLFPVCSSSSSPISFPHIQSPFLGLPLPTFSFYPIFSCYG